MKDGSVWVITRVGMYLNFERAVCSDLGTVDVVERMEEDMGAGVARIICSKGPKVLVPEWRV